MRELKFRQPNLAGGTGRCTGFHYWGFIGGCFIGPIPPLDKAKKTSQQFTGLQDKNGKDIYEGDIYKEGKRLRTVIYASSGFMGDYANGSSHRFIPNEDIEIIGNIYENPLEEE